MNPDNQLLQVIWEMLDEYAVQRDLPHEEAMKELLARAFLHEILEAQ